MPVLVRDGAGATIGSGSGFFLDVGKLVAPRSLIAMGYDAAVIVAGKEQRVTAVLAEDRPANVVLVAVDLPDGGPPAVHVAQKPNGAKESGYALGADAGAQDVQPLGLVVNPARDVPGLGLVQSIDGAPGLANGSAVVNARGELIGAAISLGAEPGQPVSYVAPASRLVSMRRVGPLPLVEWARQARTARAPEAERALVRGETAALSGRFDEAATAFDTAATADPGDADAWLALAGCRRAQHRPGDAIEAWRRAIAAQPSNARFHHELAIDLSDAGRHDLAAAEFAEVARLRPSDAEARFNLGATLGAHSQVRRRVTAPTRRRWRSTRPTSAR